MIPLIGLKAATLLKKRLWHRFFPVNFVKFLRTTFSIAQIWATAFALSFVNPTKKPVKELVQENSYSRHFNIK